MFRFSYPSDLQQLGPDFPSLSQIRRQTGGKEWEQFAPISVRTLSLHAACVFWRKHLRLSIFMKYRVQLDNVGSVQGSDGFSWQNSSVGSDPAPTISEPNPEGRSTQHYPESCGVVGSRLESAGVGLRNKDLYNKCTRKVKDKK